MASKMLMDDLQKLEEKYKNKMEYIHRKIELNFDPRQDRKFIAQYEYCCKAYYEVRTLRATHQRVFGN